MYAGELDFKVGTKNANSYKDVVVKFLKHSTGSIKVVQQLPDDNYQSWGDYLPAGLANMFATSFDKRQKGTDCVNPKVDKDIYGVLRGL